MSVEQNLKNLILKDNHYANSFLIGDTVIDGLAANENKIQFIRANYGYGKKEDWSNVKLFNEIEKISDLLNFF